MRGGGTVGEHADPPPLCTALARRRLRSTASRRRPPPPKRPPPVSESHPATSRRTRVRFTAAPTHARQAPARTRLHVPQAVVSASACAGAPPSPCPPEHQSPRTPVPRLTASPPRPGPRRDTPAPPPPHRRPDPARGQIRGGGAGGNDYFHGGRGKGGGGKGGDSPAAVAAGGSESFHRGRKKGGGEGGTAQRQWQLRLRQPPAPPDPP